MSKFGKGLDKSMQQAAQHAQGGKGHGKRVMAATNFEPTKRARGTKLLPCPFCGGEAVVMKDV